MKKYLLILLILSFLTGCMMNAAEQQAAYDRQDHTKCVGYGFKVGTNEYANCKMSLDQVRAETQKANSESLGNMGSCLSQQSGWTTTPTTLGSAIGNCQ